MSQLESRKYVSFSHTFADPWSGENAEDAHDVTLTFRFAKPNKTQIQRLQDKAAKNAGQASKGFTPAARCRTTEAVSVMSPVR